MTQCEADHECGKGYYCYHTGYCAECTNCSAYHRHQPESPSCPKEAVNCGPCLPRYVEEMLAEEGKHRDRCVLLQIPEDNISSIPVTLIILVVIGIIIILIISIILVGYYIRRFRNKGHTRTSSSHMNRNWCNQDVAVEDGNIGIDSSPGRSGEAPPAYEDVLPSAPCLQTVEHWDALPGRNMNPRICASVEDGNITSEIGRLNPQHDPFQNISSASPLLHASGSGEMETSQMEIVENQVYYKQGKEYNSLQGAQMYQRPSHPYYNSDADEEDTPTQLNSPPQLDEEETVPDSWSPPENYGHVEETAAASSEEDNMHISHESSPSEQVNSTANDSGVSDSSCQTSSTSLTRPFEHLKSSSSPSVQEECSRGMTRSHSGEDIPSTQASKRQRCDSGTQSLGDVTNDC